MACRLPPNLKISSRITLKLKTSEPTIAMKNKIITPGQHHSEPQPFYIPLNRRRFMRAIALASAGFTLKGYRAEALTIAPEVTQGPYSPTVGTMPLEKDNDLLYLNDSLTRAVGKITYLTGRVLTSSGSPISGALVELWHADNGGKYVYQKNDAGSTYDTNFQGFGQFLTGSNGAYKFRTIKAGLYNGRVRHYHLAVTIPGQLTR